MTNTLVTSFRPTMAGLYASLGSIGFPKKFIQEKILPGWWSVEVDEDPDVFMEGAMYISSRLGIDLISLVSDLSPSFLPTANSKFKIQLGTDLSSLQIGESLVGNIADQVAQACPYLYRDITTSSVAEIRSQILEKNQTVNLTSLLEFCWSQGIPVVHFSQFPPQARKFHGMVASFHGRPVIVISLNESSVARLIFVVAHELGHILKGHVSPNDILVDEKIQLESDDEQEEEANDVAVELLLGQPGISYDLRHKFLSGKILADESTRFAEVSHVEPGVIALNIAWHRAHRAKTTEDECIAWSTGRAALKILEPDANAPQIINQYLLNSLDWKILSEDDQEYLASMLDVSRDIW